jgi:recombination associated protein RdgC
MVMGLLSATTSLSRYKVDGKLDDPIIDSIAAGLKKNIITDIDGNPSDRAVGWSSFHDPFKPDFDGSSFMIGTAIVFALRIDKKSIPNKMIQKHVAAESAKRLDELGRDFLSANEKKMIKDHVINLLSLKMPATPWFFSNLKSANEELETLFIKSFGVSLVRSIPYTMAALDKRLTTAEQDALNKLSAQQDS